MVGCELVITVEALALVTPKLNLSGSDATNGTRFGNWCLDLGAVGGVGKMELVVRVRECGLGL